MNITKCIWQDSDHTGVIVNGIKVIPNSSENRDWQEVQEWVSEGNIISPYVDSEYKDLDTAKTTKISELREEAQKRFMAIVGIPGSVSPWVAEVLFKILVMVDNSYTRNPSLDPDLVSVGQLRTAYQNAATSINGLTTIQDVQNYDVVTDPAWP